jgi:acetyl esterase/lipase
LQIFLAYVPIILTGLGMILGIWSILPAPFMFLLPLSVGAPEISVWLVLLSAIGLASHFVLKQKIFPKYLRWIGIGLGVVGLILNASPLVQLSGTIDRANAAMSKAFGASYQGRISADLQAKFQSQPFSIGATVQGIKSSPKIRIKRQITFDTPSKVSLKLNLYQPPKSGKYPAVIQIYGGAWRNGSADNNEEFSRYLAAQGYVVVSIDYRHAPEHHFPAQLVDVRTAIDYVKQQAKSWEIDPDRLGLIGRSAGGHLATLAAYQPDAIPLRAVVSYYGPVDLLAGYDDPPSPDPIDSRQVMRDLLGGTPKTQAKLYAQASPLRLVDRKLPPTLLIYGGQDHIVEPRYGKKLADKLQSFGTPTVFIEIPWANHAFDTIFNGPSNQLALYYTERFFAKTLR